MKCNCSLQGRQVHKFCRSSKVNRACILESMILSSIQIGVQNFYVNRDVFNLGVVSMNTPHGNKVRTTDLERTICDIGRSRNQIDIQVRNAALKEYVKN